jgi:hypothetical protein
MDSPPKRQTLMFLLIAAFVLGLVAGLFPDGSSAERLWSLVSFVVAVVLFMRWFTLDARLHSYRISGPMYLCLVAFMALAAPFYFFATRRLGFWKSVLKSGAFLLVYCLVAGIGTVITQSITGTLR